VLEIPYGLSVTKDFKIDKFFLDFLMDHLNTCPEAISLPDGDTSNADILCVCPERKSCLLDFIFRIDILLPIANTKCS
jgi:hypothetical protein